MAGYTTILWLSIAVAYGSVEAQDEWSAANYPNPQLNPLACRPQVASGGPSFLCDPDGVLDPKYASELDAALKSVREETRCPCSANRCTMERLRNQTTLGYTVSVVLMKRRMAPVESTGSNSVQRAARFVNALRSPTNYGGRNFQRCEEDVIILFSLSDRTVYIATGASARTRLPDSRVTEIIEDSQSRFAYGAYYGIKDLVYAVWAALA